MTASQRKLKIARNPSLIDKNRAGNPSLFAHGWENVEITLDEFIVATTQRGWAYCAQLGGARKGSNFLACNIASVDVDHGPTIEEALANRLVRQHALLIYTTPRHTPEAHRFRVVFLLPETITCARRMRNISRGLTRSLGGDMAATDPTRISFGHRGAEVHHIGGELTPELLRELISDAALPENTDLPAHEIVSRRSCVTLAPDQELHLADGRRLPLCEVPPRTAVHCPVHPDENASAFVIQNRHGVPGVYCSTCSKSYWPQERRHDPCDPDEFVRTARAIAAGAVPVPPDAEVWPVSDAASHEELTGCRVRIVSGQAAPAELLPGITLVRSDKGTGKTEAMKRLSARAGTVLLVGHRRTLIRGSCKRLDMRCYLDLNKTGTKPGAGPERDTASLMGFMSEEEDED
ncbi:signal recognition particle GTPase [Methylobacterium sp. 4-46]|uniref:hypothetical protein n=1 Tax=Methylobacterium sp. (strain 4-46) TaxID=426117 RepID=UPI000152C5A4|nr:hypothetical protein [Methylobacterium sp. 4-46]ACA18635.1 signal recognition particle GTPase [Methylobacterium sp. 4-46]